MTEQGYEQITGETCPVCNAKQLTLTEAEREVPYFGKCYLFSMDCGACGYHKADIEAAEKQKPATFTLEVSSEEDLNVRVIKAADATVRVGTIGTIEPGDAANGYITNVEGILNRIKRIVEQLRDSATEEGEKEAQKRAKNHLKKLQRVLWGQESLKLTLKDPSGNSAIISEKATKK